jgi:predicted alpha/beta hydrolase family esterase
MLLAVPVAPVTPVDVWANAVSANIEATRQHKIVFILHSLRSLVVTLMDHDHRAVLRPLISRAAPAQQSQFPSIVSATEIRQDVDSAPLVGIQGHPFSRYGFGRGLIVARHTISFYFAPKKVCRQGSAL